MNMGFETEKRRHPRAEIKWPVVMMTHGGLIDGRTANLSLGGASIRFPEHPNSYRSLAMVITAKGRLISLTAEVVWSETQGRDDKSKFCKMGVRFTKIMISDRQFLSKVISNHL
jgi:hypothetical protein